MKIYENQATQPRAFLADGLQVLPSLAAVEESLRQPTWLATTSALGSAGDVPADDAFSESGPPGTVQISEDDPERVVVSTSAPSPRVLVLTDSAYPGWRATIDGRESPILTVNLLFRGVVLPAGPHQVVFTYAPRSWSLGAATTLLAAIMLLVGLLWSWRQRSAQPGETRSR